jgi:SnoaL-like domain
MPNNSLLKNPALFAKAGFLILFISCHSNNSNLRADERSLVKDSISLMTVNITNDLSAHGPVAWLNYFEDVPDFFMAVDGEMAFMNYQSAKIFIQDTLVKTIRKINLQWSHLRIDPLTTQLASIGADFHEDLTDSTGKIIQGDGYITAIAVQTNEGWKLRNLHWSINKKK